MKILKKEMIEYTKIHGLHSVPLTYFLGLFQQFEERHLNYPSTVAHLTKELDKEQKNSIFWEKRFDELKERHQDVKPWKNKCRELLNQIEEFEKQRDNLADCCEEWRKKYKIALISNLTKKQDSPWIEIDYPPMDDQTVLGINEAVSEMPMLVYYDKECREFILLNSPNAIPVSITHYMHLAKKPSESI